MEIKSIKNLDLLLQLLYNNLKQKKIIKKTSQNYFLNGKIIEPNKIKKTKKKIKKVFYKLEIGELEYLFFKDYPLNILINLGFVIGVNSEIYKITTATNTIYYTIKEYITEIEEEITKKERISADLLKNKTYKLNFKQPKYVATIKEYILKEKKLNLNKIHFYEGNGFRAFCPNKYKHDFEVAEKLKIPLVSYIEGNFIKDSNIHLKDTEYIIKIIQPYKVIEEIENVKIHKKTKEELIKDISREYYLINNLNFIDNVLERKYVINTSKYFIQERLNKRKLIRLTNPIGKIEFPIWRCNKEIVTFPHVSKLEEFSGVKLENIDSLKELFLICKNGEKAYYEEKHLREEILKKENFDKNLEKQIYFSKLDDLIISINILKILEKLDKVEYLVYEEKINEKKIDSLLNLTKNLMRKVLKKIIQENKKPEINYEKNLLTKYLESLRNELYFYLDKVKIGESRDKILNIYIKKIGYLKKFFYIFSFNEIFLLGEIIKITLIFLENFKIELKEIEDELDNFFNINKNFLRYNINLEIENIIDEIFIYNKKKFAIHITDDNNKIYNKNENLKEELKKLIEKLNLEIIEKSEISNMNKEIKINLYLIKKDFPKNYKKIIKYFNRENLSNIDLLNNEKIKITINNTSIFLEKKYFKTNLFSDRYREILRNNYVIIFKKIA